MANKFEPGTIHALDLERLTSLQPKPFQVLALAQDATAWIAPSEMVTRPGGWCALIATPDYTAVLFTERLTPRRFASLDSAGTWLGRAGIKRAFVIGLTTLIDQGDDQ